MLKQEKDVPSISTSAVGLREPIVEYNLIQVKSEPTEDSNNHATNDPLQIVPSFTNVKEEPISKECKFSGVITLEIDENGMRSYQLKCDDCPKSFPDLENFDKHINEYHLNTSKDHLYENSQNNAVFSKTISNKEGNKTQENGVKSQTLNKLESSCEKNEADERNKKVRPSDCESDSEPGVKKLKLKNNRTKVLSFDYPDKSMVTFFLKLLKTHAILWLKKHSTIKPFTEASNNFIATFKAKFQDYNMSKLNLQKAVDRMKSSYEHAKSKSISNINLEFLKLCAEIDENSKQFENNCNACKAVFYCQQELQIHKFKIHKVGELPYKCPRCSYGFSCPKKLASHMEKHDRSKCFKCETCGIAFYLESKLAAHRNMMHSEDRRTICEICGAICADAKRYRQHKRTHEPKKEKCKICSKAFLERWQLVDHMKAHQNERTYICHLCGKGFNRQKNLYIHKRGVHNMKGRPITTQWQSKHNDSNNDDDSSNDDDYMQDISSKTQTENETQEHQLLKTHNTNANLLPWEILNKMLS